MITHWLVIDERQADKRDKVRLLLCHGDTVRFIKCASWDKWHRPSNTKLKYWVSDTDNFKVQVSEPMSREQFRAISLTAWPQDDI